MNLDEALHTIDLLRAENRLLKEQLAALRDELATAQERLTELEQQQTRKKQPLDMKPSVPAREKTPRKKRAVLCYLVRVHFRGQKPGSASVSPAFGQARWLRSQNS